MFLAGSFQSLTSSKHKKHIDICLEYVSTNALNWLIQELKFKSESDSVPDCSMELHKLTKQLESLVSAGSTVDEIVKVVTQIGLLLRDDDPVITVYGMRLKANSFEDDKIVLQFKVKNIATFIECWY